MLKKVIIKMMILFLLISSLTFAQTERGNKKNKLPVYDEIKSLLPVPIVSSEPTWIDMYWFCWELAFKKLKSPLENSPFIANYIDEAFAPQIFQWDTHFMIQFWKYAHHIFPAIESHDNFYVCQDEEGYICRELHEADGTNYFYRGKQNTINPPLFSWVEYDYYKMTGDHSRFTKVIPIIDKYLQWIEKNRRYNTRHNLFWQTNLGSGMDNSPRSGSGWVDMSAQMALAYECLSKMADIIGDQEKKNVYWNKYQEIGKNINEYMWNDKDGLYYDIQDNGEQIVVKTVASFWPLLANVSSEEQKEKLINNLKDKNTFNRIIPFATLSAAHPSYNPVDGYWLGSIWAPTNYMVIKGLENYGQNKFAYESSLRYLKGMDAVFQKTGTVWENYNPDEYIESNRAKEDFVGWTGLGPIALLIESVIGIKTDAPENTINWHINRIDKHGIKNLRVGKTTVTLICHSRKTKEDKVIINIETDESVTLNLYKNGKKKYFNVSKGKMSIDF